MGKITFALKAIHSTKDWGYISAVCDTFIIIFRITNYKIKRGHSITYTGKVNLDMTSFTKKNREQKATPAQTPYPHTIHRNNKKITISIFTFYACIGILHSALGSTVPRCHGVDERSDAALVCGTSHRVSHTVAEALRSTGAPLSRRRRRGD